MIRGAAFALLLAACGSSSPRAPSAGDCALAVEHVIDLSNDHAIATVAHTSEERAAATRLLNDPLVLEQSERDRVKLTARCIDTARGWTWKQITCVHDAATWDDLAPCGVYDP